LYQLGRRLFVSTSAVNHGKLGGVRPAARDHRPGGGLDTASPGLGRGGFIGGLALGRVPFGSVVAGAIAGPRSRWAEIGRGVGEIVGGGFAFAAGMAGMLGGGAASVTGVGTVPGVLAVAGSAALVAGGMANVMTGAERLGQALSMSSGSGSSGPQGKPSASGTKPVHGNDLSTTKPAQGYSLRDRDTGEVLKYGETTLGRSRYTKQYLEKHNAKVIFANSLPRKDGADTLHRENVDLWSSVELKGLEFRFVWAPSY